MNGRGVLLMLLVGLAAAGCRERGPTGPPPRLVLSADSVTLPSIGAHTTVEATVGPHTTTTPALRVVAEDRWIADRPVLDALSLATSRILADGPGTAEVQVKAFDAAPGTVYVDVLPRQPVALEVEPERAAPGDTVTVRGYRMDAVDSSGVTVSGLPVKVVGEDSASLRFLAPPGEQPTSCSGNALAPLKLPGAIEWAGVKYLRPRTGELDLPVGKVVRLDAAERQCLRLVPLRDYALAYLDTREVAAEQRNSVPDWTMLPLSIRDLSGNVPSAELQVAGQVIPSNSRRGQFPAADARRRSAVSATDTSSCETGRAVLFPHDSAWTPGEHFEMCWDWSVEPATVLLVRDPLVIAVLDRDSTMLHGPLLPYTDSAASYLAAGGLAFMEKEFGATLPTSAPGSGQILVVYSPGQGGGSSWSYFVNGTIYGYVFLGADYSPGSPGAVLRVLAHELTHQLQSVYVVMHQDTAGPNWPSEGEADFLADQVVRRYIGIPFLSNWKGWRSAVGSRAAYRGGGGGYDFAYGYGAAASFMSYLTSRLMVDGGMSYDAALRLVLQKSQAGWYTDMGLTAAVRPYLGPDWSPEDALLDWTLGQAVDDLTSNPLLQNLQFYRTSWCGVVVETLASGDQPPLLCPADAVIIPGKGGYTEQRQIGSTSFFYIHDQVGATLRLEGDSLDWDLVRYH